MNTLQVWFLGLWTRQYDVMPPEKVPVTLCASVYLVHVTPLLTHADVQLCHSIRPGSRRDRHTILDFVPYLCTGRVEGSKGYPCQTDVLDIWHDFEVLLSCNTLLYC